MIPENTDRNNSKVVGWERVEQRAGSVSPCQRSLHSGALWRDNFLVFGGYDGRVRLNDLHCFNFTSRRWSVLNSARAPSPRDRHSAVIFENQLVVFGGFDGVSRVSDLHAFDLERREWRLLTGFSGHAPSARHSHCCVSWRELLIVFGGFDGTYRNDLHCFHFDTQTWIEVDCGGEIPRPRYRGSCVVSSDKLILFGGHDGSAHLNDCHSLSLSSLSSLSSASASASGSAPPAAWVALDTQGRQPSPRDSHLCVTHAQRMLVYGGSSGSALEDLHALSLTQLAWTHIDTHNSSINMNNSQNLSQMSSQSNSPRNVSFPSQMRVSRGEELFNSSMEYSRMSLSGELEMNHMNSLNQINNLNAMNQMNFPPSSGLLFRYNSPLNSSHSFMTGFNGVPGMNGNNSTNSTNSTNSYNNYNGMNTPLASTSTLCYGSSQNNQRNNNNFIAAGKRFCHVGVVYEDSLYVFGGYDGSQRLNDFIKLTLEPPLDDLPHSTLLQDLKSLVDNELLSDVSFIVEGVSVKAHKVMCLRCPYFRNLLTGEYMESSDVRHSIFLQFLEFVYTDQVDITFDSAMELFQAADRFGAERLKKACESVMLQALSVETAGHILRVADCHRAEVLRDKCISFISALMSNLEISTMFPRQVDLKIWREEISIYCLKF